MTYQTQVSIPYFTMLPTDVMTNVLHWNWPVGPPPEPADFATLANVLSGFYNDVYSAGHSIAAYTVPAATRIKIYNLADPTPRVPVYDATLANGMVKAVTTKAPPEMAMVVSYQAALVSGEPQASRRGRMYLGALADNWIDAGTESVFPNPAPSLELALNSAVQNMISTALGADWIFVVLSRKLNTAAIVTNGWIDNAFDTQRRRGNAPTSRVVWP